jgi:sugar O-acyltransferase (sialic acid O-acetyltransferase NeuD family)
MQDTILIGGGEHAAVVLDAFRAAHPAATIRGYTGERPGGCGDLEYLGTDSVIGTFEKPRALLGIGAIDVPDRRVQVVTRLSPSVGEWPVVCHPTAYVAPDVTIGMGTVVMAGAIIQPRTRIGAFCIINTGARIDHDCVVEEHVIIAPGAVLGGAIHVGAATVIGLGALVRDHVTIGAASLVGMGSVVVRDVPPGVCVLGVPARVTPKSRTPTQRIDVR